jgi:hypothetical protein
MSWIDKLLSELLGPDEHGLTPKQKLQSIIAKYRISGDRIETKLNVLMASAGLEAKRVEVDKYFDGLLNQELAKLTKKK